MDQGVAALIGASISAVVLLAAQFIGNTYTARVQRDQLRADRLARFETGVRRHMRRLGRIARASTTRLKRRLDDQLAVEALDQLVAALLEIRLLDRRKVTDAASAVYEGMNRAYDEARARHFGREEWRVRRYELIDEPLENLQVVARKAL